MDLKNQAALVTGGAIRVGRAIALELAQAGCPIALHYGRSRGEAQATATQIRALGVHCRIYQADLSKAKSVLALGARVLKDFGLCPCSSIPQRCSRMCPWQRLSLRILTCPTR